MLKLLPVPELQPVPPSKLNCQVAPASRPLTLTVRMLVMKSLLLEPESVASDSVGAAAAVSSVKVNALLAGLVLPAASVCLTKTLLSPSPVMPVMLVPEPLLQLVPPFRLYCQVAPTSSPVMFKLLILVILSVLLEPESVASDSEGADAAVSSVKANALLAALVLPAASVCLTKTLLSPSPVMPVMLVPEPLLQLVPPFRLYCQVDPTSNPVTFKLLVFVRVSLLLVPESVVKFKPGAKGMLVSSVKANALLAGLALPAASIALNETLPWPGCSVTPVQVKLVPLTMTSCQLSPPLSVACSFSPLAKAALSVPVMVWLATLVIQSLALTPVSTERLAAMMLTCGAVVSMVKVLAALAALRLPAASST